MKPLRLAMIGAGSMARYHLAAAKHVGFELSAIAAKPNSERARELGSEFGVSACYRTSDDLIAADDWDAMVIAVDVPATLELMVSAAASGRPVLVEKPVAELSAHLDSLVEACPRVRVAYNRRFYQSVGEAKDFVGRNSIVQVFAQVPENVEFSDGGLRALAVRYNSVHVLDLLRFLLGDLKVVSVEAVGNLSDDIGRAMTLRNDAGSIVVVYANWNHPANFAVAIDGGHKRFELRPIEFGFLFDGMKVVEPTDERPLRTYTPLCVKKIGLEPEANRFKPGFLGQMKAFHDFTLNPSEGRALATLGDAQCSLTLAEHLIG